MAEFLDFVFTSEAFHILGVLSAFVALGFELYVRRTTTRSTEGPVLDADLQAFFAKLQLKWGSRHSTDG